MRRAVILSALGLSVWGCGPPMIVPMTPPGVTLPHTSADQAEALGERRNQGNVKPTDASQTRPAGKAAPAGGAAPKVSDTQD